jgi:murein DD-endopeptidase MepM/ murein hydrolase activator NlpD
LYSGITRVNNMKTVGGLNIITSFAKRFLMCPACKKAELCRQSSALDSKNYRVFLKFGRQEFINAKLVLIRKISTVMLIISLNLVSLPIPVFAQDASESATPTTSETPTPLSGPTETPPPVSETPTPAPSVTPFETPIESSTSALITPTIAPMIPTSAPSANIKVKAKLQPLSKRLYRGNETVKLTVDRGTAMTVDITVTDSTGATIQVPLYRNSTDNTETVSIVPPYHFKPGKYTVTMTDDEGTVSSQDFSWGVLAINTNKSIYAPAETAHMYIAVLDDGGRIVCNAGVTLTVTDPGGTSTTLTMSDGSITVNPTCGSIQSTNTPDYETTYQTAGSGSYALHLSAVTANGTRELDDGFEVRDSVPFDVERVTATRIYPPNTYTVIMNVKANTDFTGEVIETVPLDFAISQVPSSLLYNDLRIVSQRLDVDTDVMSIRKPFDGQHVVTLGFGERVTDPQLLAIYTDAGLAGHDGVDFDMSDGTPILAVDDGEVVASGDLMYGTTIVIQHRWGRSYYGHLSIIDVSSGKVTKGQEIGLSGHTGIATGPHLHFGIKLNGSNINNGYYGKTDPMPFFDTTAVASPQSVKELVWRTNLAKGATLTLGYTYKAPNVSPQFYLLGPLTFETVNTSPSQPSELLEPTEASSSSNVSYASPSSQFFESIESSHSSSLPTLSEVEGSLVPSTLTQGSLAPVFSEIRRWQIAADATSYITTGTTSYAVPIDWHNNNNTIEVIGGSGGGATGGNGQAASGGGGGGGAYSKATNVNMPRGTTVTVAVGSAGGIAGTGGDSYVCNSTSNCADITGSAVRVGAKGGGGASGSTQGTGGQASSGFGATKYNGGNGGNGATASGNAGGGGGGGGGAGGPSNNGNAGSTNTTTTGGNGGQGDGSSGGIGGTGGAGGNPGATGGTGGSGTEWDASHGSGGGGGGGGGGANTNNNGGVGGIAGSYGAAGGGGGAGGKNAGTGGAGRAGNAGLIIITYTSPTIDQVLRHGTWFSGGVKQGFWEL